MLMAAWPWKERMARTDMHTTALRRVPIAMDACQSHTGADADCERARGVVLGRVISRSVVTTAVTTSLGSKQERPADGL
jgi:hypothetical protein